MEMKGGAEGTKEEIQSTGWGSSSLLHPHIPSLYTAHTSPPDKKTIKKHY